MSACTSNREPALPSLVEKLRRDFFEGGVEISVGKDDLRVLAAQFEAHLLEILGGGCGDHAAHSSGSGEGRHLGHPGWPTASRRRLRRRAPG